MGGKRAELLRLSFYSIAQYSIVYFSIAVSIKVASFGHWELGIGKLLYGGHSSKSLHCSIRPNVQLPMTNYQSHLF